MSAFIIDALVAVKAEQQRRINALPPDTYDALNHWSDVDDPFINELSLLMLVAAFHETERTLVRLATDASLAGGYATSREYEIELVRQRERLRKSRKEFLVSFGGESIREYAAFHALNLIANCYKHEPEMKPTKDYSSS